jgi:hypothetical protein
MILRKRRSGFGIFAVDNVDEIWFLKGRSLWPRLYPLAHLQINRAASFVVAKIGMILPSQLFRQLVSLSAKV